MTYERIPMGAHKLAYVIHRHAVEWPQLNGWQQRAAEALERRDLLTYDGDRLVLTDKGLALIGAQQ